MKVVLFDTILERHLYESLARAFEQRGHEVVSTDLILHGHSMIESKSDIKIMEKAIDKYIDSSVDLVIAFRPMNLTSEMVKQIGKKATTAIWLSDDPVLYKTCYASVIDSYDIILHCGSEKVLDFYERKGHKKGVNFPFWSDNEAIPYCYSPLDAKYDGIFLGNMHGDVRHKRYAAIGELKENIKVFGLVDSDMYGMHGGNITDGYINIDKITNVLKYAKYGISIPQFFKDYVGLDEYYFDGLENLGYFQFPSRVIQYAAAGLPIAAVGDIAMKEVFPEIFVSKNIEGLKSYLVDIRADLDFALNESENIKQRFNKSYSAQSRVRFLESLMGEGVSILNENSERRSKEFFNI